jgi:hypothetical protein
MVVVRWEMLAFEVELRLPSGGILNEPERVPEDFNILQLWSKTGSWPYSRIRSIWCTCTQTNNNNFTNTNLARRQH